MTGDYDAYESDGLVRFGATSLVVDGIPSVATSVLYQRQIVEIIDEHECARWSPHCFFDLGAGEVHQPAGAEMPPMGQSTSPAYRWIPGDPVYVGSPS